MHTHKQLPLDAHMWHGVHYPKRTQQPEYRDDDHSRIEDFLDFPIHGDVRVNEPKRDTCNEEHDKDRD